MGSFNMINFLQVILAFLLSFSSISESRRPSYCSLFKCPSPPNCCESGQYTYNERLCCMVCAKQEGKICGGASGARGKCAQGLQCLKTCLACKTVGANSKPCIFPFKYAGIKNNKCTARDSDNGRSWCATMVDREDDNHVIDDEWGDCGDGCPGTGLECNERYFQVKEGICINLATPGSVPSGPGAPAVHLLGPTEDLVPSPVCNSKGSSKRRLNKNCHCDRGVTAASIDDKGRMRGNCTGVPFNLKDNKEEYWCFIENVQDPFNPTSRCYADVRWSSGDGRFWSFKGCLELDENRKQTNNSALMNKAPGNKKIHSKKMLAKDKAVQKRDPKRMSLTNDRDKIRKRVKVSSNGRRCIFPFRYDEKSYTACTFTDSENGKPWCATGIDQEGFVIDGNWGDCSDNTDNDREKMNQQGTQHDIIEALKDVSANNQIKIISSNKKACIFPFKYDNESYSGCTIKDSETGVSWCATGVDDEGYVVDDDWGECLGTAEDNTVEKIVQPERSTESSGNIMKTQKDKNQDVTQMVRNNEKYASSIINTPKLSPNHVESRNENEQSTNKTPQSVQMIQSQAKMPVATINKILKVFSFNKKVCIFPFKYDGNSYAGCTIKDSETGVPWCATGVDEEGYVVDDDWGECLDTSEENKRHQIRKTAIPKDSTENSITKIKEQNIELQDAMTVKSDNQISAFKDNKTIPQKHLDASFVIETQSFKEVDNDAKVKEYDLDKTTKKEVKVYSSNRKVCIFPFYYEGESYTCCTLKDTENGLPWCATGVDDEGYVVDDDWGECLATSDSKLGYLYADDNNFPMKVLSETPELHTNVIVKQEHKVENMNTNLSRNTTSARINTSSVHLRNKTDSYQADNMNTNDNESEITEKEIILMQPILSIFDDIKQSSKQTKEKAKNESEYSNIIDSDFIDTLLGSIPVDKIKNDNEKAMERKQISTDQNLTNVLPLKVLKPEDALEKPKEVKRFDDILKTIIQSGAGVLGLNLWATEKSVTKISPRPVYIPDT